LRLITVLSNLLALPAIYLLGRRLFGKTGAYLSCVFFVLSIWEIEFARFARMYAPFQTIFLWYLVFLFRVLIDKDNRSWKWLFILSFASIFIYEAAIFLLLFNFIPIILNYSQKEKIHLFCSAVLFILGYLFLSTDFRYLGTLPYLPPDLPAVASSDGGSILFPKILLFATPHDAMWIFLVLAAASLSIVSIFRLINDAKLNILVTLCLCTIIGMSFFNLFGLLIMFSAVCYLFGTIQWDSLSHKVLKECCFVIVFNFIFWIFFCSTTDDWYHLLEGMEHFSAWKLLVVLFKYPDVFTQIIYPFLNSIPKAFVLSAIVIVSGVFAITKKGSIKKEYQTLLAILLICFLLIGIVKTPYTATRYSFFFYPIILLLVAGSICLWATFFLKNKKTAHFFMVLFALIYMTGVEDFGVYHLAGVESKDVNFRSCYNFDRKVHYYLRLDYETPAKIINKNFQKNDIIVSTIVPVEYYLNKNLDYTYTDQNLKEFEGILACSEKKHLWTNANLLYTEEMLLNVLDNNHTTVWLITSSMNKKFYKSKISTKINKIYKNYFVGQSQDGLINVYKIKSRHGKIPGINS